MNDATAWYELGVKQQENEREHKALQALERAVGLDPSHLPSWLALAISYTNASNRQGTYDAICEWVSRNEKYQEAVKQFRSQFSESNGSLAERYRQLIQCLITMARCDVTGDIDADIQVALAVLLNTNEVCPNFEYTFYVVLKKVERNMKRPKIALKRHWPSDQRYSCPFISSFHFRDLILFLP
jgi:tetratricopeptide (TPR) repeat protein